MEKTENNQKKRGKKRKTTEIKQEKTENNRENTNTLEKKQTGKKGTGNRDLQFMTNNVAICTSM